MEDRFEKKNLKSTQRDKEIENMKENLGDLEVCWKKFTIGASKEENKGDEGEEISNRVCEQDLEIF